MYEVTCLNENGDKFSKTFDSYYQYEKYLNKVKHSKKLTLLSYGKIY